MGKEKDKEQRRSGRPSLLMLELPPCGSSAAEKPELIPARGTKSKCQKGPRRIDEIKGLPIILNGLSLSPAVGWYP